LPAPPEEERQCARQHGEHGERSSLLAVGSRAEKPADRAEGERSVECEERSQHWSLRLPGCDERREGSDPRGSEEKRWPTAALQPDQEERDAERERRQRQPLPGDRIARPAEA
jgi:hypothetical protein